VKISPDQLGRRVARRYLQVPFGLLPTSEYTDQLLPDLGDILGRCFRVQPFHKLVLDRFQVFIQLILLLPHLGDEAGQLAHTVVEHIVRNTQLEIRHQRPPVQLRLHVQFVRLYVGKIVRLLADGSQLPPDGVPFFIHALDSPFELPTPRVVSLEPFLDAVEVLLVIRYQHSQAVGVRFKFSYLRFLGIQALHQVVQTACKL
uniref:Uncharacterized protein n=1 Tax=Anopheles atroparvus TaxID=41427 RepID=A0AAG5DBG6_ANOAO